MTSKLTSADNGDSRLEQVLAAYLHSVEAGQPLDPEEVIAKHPELADELRSYFDNRRAMERLVAPLKGAADEPTIGMPQESVNTTSGKRVRYLGDYELLEEIARGGMGVVYKALQASLNRIVAVKMILAGTLADESAVRRFRHEAEAAANLDHPCIVPVYEVGEHQGQHYFSMGFVQGQSLAAKLAGGPLAPRDAAQLLEQVARAVEYAHERGVIHRDLKPANVLLDQQGRPRITDFGLAKVASREQSLTDTGQALGTPGYMPPEQVDGKEIGPQADVYGLGAILYALLTGRPPFQAATPLETMLQVLSADAAPPRQLNPGVPRDLDTIAMKCLEKWPEARYKSAKDLADDLSRFVAGEPILARPPGIVELGMRWLTNQRRSVLTASAAAAISAVVIVGGILGTLAYRESRQGGFKLDTEHPRLVADVRDDVGQVVVEPFTVPTEKSVAVPEGDYRLRVSGRNWLSEDVLLQVDRRTTSSHKVSFESSRLWDEQPVNGSWHLVRCRGPGYPAHLVILNDKEVELRETMNGGQAGWKITPEVPKELEHAQGKWLSSQGGNSKYGPSSVGKSDFRPFVLTDAPQLDGGTWGDLVIALRHQPAILAVSSEQGKVLWCYAATLPESLALGRNSNVQWSGTVVGAPLVVPDLDGDGVVDLIACLMVLEAGHAEKPLAIPDQPRRTLDAISGKTGQRIWQYELDDQWFDLPPGVAVPYANRWFPTNPQGSAGGEGRHSPFGNTFRDFIVHMEGGDEVFLPNPPLLVRQGETRRVVCVAGRRVVTVEIAAELRTTDHDLGFAPARPPQAADLDGDGEDELVLIESTSRPTWQAQAPGTQRLGSWSLAKGGSLWPPREQIADYDKHANSHWPTPTWPVVADLNGDGRAEILTANGTSTDFKPPLDENRRAWGGLELIDGRTGQPLWERRLQTIDQQVDQFVVGPDIDGDGWRDLFAATLFSRGAHLQPGRLCVDALSGKDGRTLWHANRLLPQAGQLDHEFIGQLAWWTDGPDGWPQLLVPVIDWAGGLAEPVLLAAFSAGSGAIVRESKGFRSLTVADADGDGTNDLLCLIPRDSTQMDLGGKLLSFRGMSPVPWRRLDGRWQAGRDYDSDGFDDVVAREVVFRGGEQQIVALSGCSGRELYRTPVNTPTWAGARIRPLDVDLDGDGVCDLLTTDGHRGGDGETPSILAYSGKTGRSLWRPTFGAGNVEHTLLVEPRDLDGDGRFELIYVAALSFRGADGSPPPWTKAPLWLVVLDGRSGQLRWKHALSEEKVIHMADDGRAFAVAYADLNADGVLDVITSAFGVAKKRELRALNGKTGELLWEPHTLELSFQYYNVNELPVPVATDLDGDRRPEFLLQELVNGSPPPFRCSVLDGASGQVRWTKDFPTDNRRMLMDGGWDCIRDRPRPLVVELGDKKRGIALWLWGDKGGPGHAVVLDAMGNELWRLPVAIANTAISSNRVFRLWAYDLDGDDRDELLLINGSAIEAYELSEFKPVWRHEFALVGGAALLSIRPATRDVPPVIEFLSGRTLTGLAGKTGQPLWTCTGLPESFQPSVPLDEHLQRLAGPADHPPSLLAHLGREAGDTLCLRASPADVSPFTPVCVPYTAVLPRDPRFARWLPWQIDPGWPLNSPAWIAMGLLFFLPTLILLPSWSLYKIIWQRRWSLQFWLLLPLVVLLFLIALTAPNPSDTPPISPLKARFQVAFWSLPIAAFPCQVISWLRAGQKRRLAWWLGIALVTAILIGALIYTIHWRLTPSNEYWVFDARSSLPFLWGLYLAAALSVAVAIFEHCLWHPLMIFVRRRSAPHKT